MISALGILPVFPVILAGYFLLGCGRQQEEQKRPEPAIRPTLTVISPAFAEGAMIPAEFTGEGSNISPPIKWSGAPARTQSYALICDDPDAPGGTWVHWVLFNLPPGLTELQKGVPRSDTVLGGALQGRTSFQSVGYGGPYPPRGERHHYFFKVYALDILLPLAAGASKDDVLRAMQGHTLAEGHVMGLYERR